ncbi:glutamate synthase large subunit [uncultured Cyclobacterium sp.]|uniref:glutamate synthase large subunit n=1 Tax=uncultured Cyclobacterium sp. TaxID=453820 RepID=UPI0030ED1C43|tara:strand:- start:80207 stop:84700 length:4494 start_codon:yes stop_codon:yes gene_type:complete
MNQGLYRSEFEHDACGIGSVVNVKGLKSHETISDALLMLSNMEHRGGRGSDPKTGDGAGILIQLPHTFLKEVTQRLGFGLPEEGFYGVGMVFFPNNKQLYKKCKSNLNKIINELGFKLIGYRAVPTDDTVPGSGALEVMPNIEQVFVQHKDNLSGLDLERKLFVLRNYATSILNSTIPGVNSAFYFASFSSQTLIYKGQLRTDQVLTFYKDLQNNKLKSAIALVHSRFSTNTFPNWRLAQPFRFLSHNGEINTIRGNLNKMRSKETLMKSIHFTDEELQMLLPITNSKNSDSANLDSMVELLALSGRSLPHVLMMLVPEAWQDNKTMDKKKKAFYKFHASLVEPWDGPAALLFTDGKSLGATLDRNGLRPLRYFITSDDRLILSSEAGALPIRESTIIEKGRISPGRMLLADLSKGKISFDEEVKDEVVNRKPYDSWIKKERLKLRMIPAPTDLSFPYNTDNIKKKQTIFGYSQEDLKVILSPMGDTAYEPIGSMGADTPLAVLSKQSQHISNYFKQLFAQVSNPPIDPIRERLVMSLFTRIGESYNILEESAKHTRQVHISQPVLLNEDLEKLRNLEEKGYHSATLNAHFEADGKPGRLLEALNKLCQAAEDAIGEGKNIIIISDRNSQKDTAPIPSLLAVGAVHHHLVNQKLRTKAGLVVEAGDIRETHHFATAIGYGASAINPYLALETLISLNDTGMLSKKISQKKLFENYKEAIGKGLLKVLSKMGISTLQSYQSAQIFEAIGLGAEVIDRCFKGTVSRISGVSFDELADEVLVRHHTAYKTQSPLLEAGGVYQWKRRGEKHLFNPETIHLLQKSTQLGDYNLYKKFAKKINDQTKDAMTLRGLLEFKKRISVPIDEVEPVEAILKRFATGAMSFGSISHEAHSTLAIAMNRIGAKSNSGEGGEDEVRFEKKENGDWQRSAIKQVASGRFGVTSNYLTNAAELQIKMAQGAKPGEGGQLPGHKVDDWIGKVRHSTPGVGLISPPPHHDIYSIEDLAQLIYDLKNANRKARINVKLVSQAGVGTVAAGVAKAQSDVILISGADGGTGASPLSSIRHAGLPWELGLSEAHQTLVINNLRSRVTLQTDGQLRTGRDLAIAVLLGAEEWGISTGALVVEGCIMMRKCHLNTCPVGIATQNPELRKLFTGNPDHVVNFFTFLAQDLREIMASLGFRTVNEMVGQSNILKEANGQMNHWKWDKLDLSPIFHKVEVPDHVGIHKQIDQDFRLKKVLDRKLIEAATPALEQANKVTGTFDIINVDRSVGAMLSNEVSKFFGSPGLPDNTIHFKFRGSAGQTFGGFLAKGITFELEGEANDYFGKGLSGGKLIVYPNRNANFVAEDNIIIGNVAFYGATSGHSYIKGKAGERFCVRNSGVEAVVEGIGDHGCEYMTGGLVIILGEIGRNFAAGMSGGIAYIFKENLGNINKEMVDIDPLNEDDYATIKNSLSEHVALTSSNNGANLLEDWEAGKERFIKVIPKDYKEVLRKRALENSKTLV